MRALRAAQPCRAHAPLRSQQQKQGRNFSPRVVVAVPSREAAGSGRAHRGLDSQWRCGASNPKRSQAHGFQSSKQPDAASSDPTEVLDSCLQHIQAGDHDALLEFVPDELLDRVLAWRKLTGRTDAPLRCEDVLQSNSGLSAGQSEGVFLDTYALRNLVYAAPASRTLLSVMRLGRDRYMQRCAIVGPYGEECVLTFELVRQELLETRYRGVPLITKRWMLASVRGESSSTQLPAHPSPSFTPEAVVEAQLQAVRSKAVSSIFAHASPQNKQATGPVQSYAAMLGSSRYAPLTDWEAAETVRRLQPSETSYMEVVRVTPRGGGAPLMYMWIVSRQGEGSIWHGCWMVDAVQFLGDKLPAQVQPWTSAS